MSRGAYGAPVPAGGGVVAATAAGGPAARVGILPGERILEVDGHPLRDVIDWRWLTAGEGFDALVADAEGATRSVRVEPRWDEALGAEFAGALFDGVRECDNACEFCFVAQLPPGLRPSLYVRDDDFRLSFLSGNFVTLTNLGDDDVDRILEQRLSPLYVSLHAVDPEVRRTLLCATGEDRALEHVDRLLGGRIDLHVQIVLVPGLNDGEALERSLVWLAAREGVVSVGVVPVGFTRHQRRYTASYGHAADAAAVLHALERWRARMRTARGVPWVYGSDELYLAAAHGIPPAEDYAGFPQYENGIGMVRAFVDAWEGAAAGSHAAPEPLAEFTLVTGELFGPVLRGLAPSAERAGVRCRVLPVPNRFLGGNVSVAGLLAARDVADAVRADGASGIYLVPDAMLNTDGITLDDVSAADLPALCAADVRVVSSDAPDPLDEIRTVTSERDR